MYQNAKHWKWALRRNNNWCYLSMTTITFTISFLFLSWTLKHIAAVNNFFCYLGCPEVSLRMQRYYMTIKGKDRLSDEIGKGLHKIPVNKIMSVDNKKYVKLILN